MRIGFAGSESRFTASVLESLIKRNNKPVVVYLKIDKKKGRGLKNQTSNIKIICKKHQIRVLQPDSFRYMDALLLKKFNLDLFFVASYGKIIPAFMLNVVKYGFFNLHPSLLPRWQGASPIKKSISSGDFVTGVSIVQVTRSLDVGNIYMQCSCSIDLHDTCDSLELKLATLGSFLLHEFISRFAVSSNFMKGQLYTSEFYASKVEKSDGLLSWNNYPFYIFKKIKAYVPWPVAYTTISGVVVRIWDAELVNDYSLPYIPRGHIIPGTVCDLSVRGIVVSCKSGFVLLKSIQFPGKKIISAGDYVNNNNKLIRKNMLFY